MYSAAASTRSAFIADTLCLHCRQAACKDGLADQRKGNTLVEGSDSRPLSGTLLTCGVKDLVNQRLSVLVLLGQDLAGDLDEIAVELGLVPLREDLVHLVGIHAQKVLHELIGLADELHIAVLDSVVDHLHEVACSAVSYPVTAGTSVLDLGADCLEDRFYQRPCLGRSAGHHGRALQSTLFSAGNTGSDVEKALGLDICTASDCVGEVAVAAVDDYIARLKHGKKLLDEVVHRLACLDEHENLAGSLEVGSQFLDAVASDNVLALCTAVDEVVDLGDCSVVDGNGEALGLHVHYEVLAHDGKSDQSDICFLSHYINSFNNQRLTRAFPL